MSGGNEDSLRQGHVQGSLKISLSREFHGYEPVCSSHRASVSLQKSAGRTCRDSVEPDGTLACHESFVHPRLSSQGQQENPGSLRVAMYVFFSCPLVSGLAPMQSSPRCVSFLSEHIVASSNGSTRAVIQRNTTNRNVCNRYSHQNRKHSGPGQARHDQT